MKLSIIIVNWNSAEYLDRCLASLGPVPDPADREMIVIDNASHDGSGRLIDEKYPHVQFIQNEINQGFGQANNTAAREATGDLLLFLNPDTEMRPGSLDNLLAHFADLPNAGAVGGRLYNTDGSLQTSCVQRFPTVLNQAVNLELLRTRFPGLSIWGIAPLYGATSKPAQVEMVSGACLAIAWSTFVRIGGFREDLFLYAEDLDLCYRLARAGFNNYYIPTVELTHHGGKSTGGKSTLPVRESVQVFLRDTRGRAYARAYRISQGIVAAIRLAVLALAWPVLKKKSQERMKQWRPVVSWGLALRSTKL